jgi:hypothetical protein
MPLHDWRDDRGWDGFHAIWLARLLDWVQPRLPQEYRAFLGSVPALTVDSTIGRPDVTVRGWQTQPAPAPVATGGAVVLEEPDFESAAVFTFDPQKAVHIDFHGQLIAAIELVSPRNKDRPESRNRYLNRYAGYLRQGVQLLLVDVLPRPHDFSFAEEIAADIGFPLPPCPPPFAISYRVGEPVPEGTLTAVWRRPFQVGETLPTLPLPLTVFVGVPIDLETTYMETAQRVYLA